MKYLGAPQSGSQANTTASKNRAGQYYRNRRSPVQPVGTGRRAVIRSAFSAASKAWSALTGEQQAAFSAYAASYPVTDSLGQAITLTGHQMFVALRTQQINAGLDLLVAPPDTNAVAPMETVALTVVAGTSMSLAGAGAMNDSDRYLIAFSPPQSGGVGSCKLFWQQTVVPGNETGPYNAFAAYSAQFGLVRAGQRIFYKITPVNSFGVTGTPQIGFAAAT